MYISKPIKIFYSEKELILFLADSINTHGYMDSNRWESEYFDNQNIVGSDLKTYVYTTIQEGKLIKVPEYSYRLYHFYNSSGKVIDVRNYKKKIFKLVYARLVGLVNEKYTQKRYSKKKIGKTPTSHTCWLARKDVRYMRTARVASIPEYAEYIPADEKKLKTKWYDDFWGRGECSWKRQFKCKHQWEKHMK